MGSHEQLGHFSFVDCFRPSCRPSAVEAMLLFESGWSAIQLMHIPVPESCACACSGPMQGT